MLRSGRFARSVPGVAPRVLAAGALAVGALGGGCLLPLPTPSGRAGRLTTPDGRPVASATVIVETLDIMTPPSGGLPGTPIHRLETRTDREGRWEVRGRIALRIGLPLPDALPLQLDEYTFTAPDGRTLRRRPGLDTWRSPGEVPKVEPALRADWDARPPVSVSILPAFGVMGGAAQTVSGHLGGLLLVGRAAFGLGLRAAAEAGAAGAGASAALVIPYRASAPLFGLELGARYLRPWSNGGSPDWIAPEIALDVSNLRFTLTLLDLGAGASLGDRRPAFGIGWGFF
ncbi:MAG TPA: hypothetical protein VH853_13710 [Polyangia bacterium]|nr:hypothetical protein [Polyangia bacterium]